MPDVLLGGISLSEVLADPHSLAGSTGPRLDIYGNGTATSTDAFMETANISGVPINIGGVQLCNQILGNRFTLPTGTLLQPGRHAMVMKGVNAGPGPALGPLGVAFCAGRGSAVLNNGPENVILRDKGSNICAQIAHGGASIVTPGVPGAFFTFPTGAPPRVDARKTFSPYTPGLSIQRAPYGCNIPSTGAMNDCFAGATLIAPPQSPRAIETCWPGNAVLTVTGLAETVL